MDMYQNMRDALAPQYGGFTTHNIVFLERYGRETLTWELDFNYCLHVGSNGDDSHAYDAWYKK